MGKWASGILTVVWLLAGCATTRYEEYGDSPREEGLTDTPPGVEAVVVGDREMLEARLQSLEQRLLDLEMLVQVRPEEAEDTASLAARVTALSEQVQELRRQVQAGRLAPVALPAEPVVKAPEPPVARKADVNALYDQALQAFDRQAYREARVLFERILALEPTGPLADNAQYWVGECAYAVEDYTGALDAFKRVFQYAETEKDDDAQIKLGYAYLKLRDLDSALIEFKRLTVDYPQSEYLPRAEEQIRRIRAAKASAP